MSFAVVRDPNDSTSTPRSRGFFDMAYRFLMEMRSMNATGNGHDLGGAGYFYDGNQPGTGRQARISNPGTQGFYLGKYEVTQAH